MANGDEAGQQGNNKSKRKCVTCLTAVLRDSKLGNYTTDKYNPLYRELFPGFDGVDGSICGSCYKRCYSERKKRGLVRNGAGATKREPRKRKTGSTTTTTTNTTNTTTNSSSNTTTSNGSSQSNSNGNTNGGDSHNVTMTTSTTTTTTTTTSSVKRQRVTRYRRVKRMRTVYESSSSSSGGDEELSEDENDRDQSVNGGEKIDVYFELRFIRENGSSSPMGVLKSFIPSSILLESLKRIALKNVNETFDSDVYKVKEIKLYERDISGEKIEVDLVDEDSFMAFPVEEKTRFIVYVTKSSSH